MKMRLAPGIPKQSDYLRLLKNNIFIQIEQFSNDFLRINKKKLENYHLIKDPLHQIFRQWEYPFCYSYIEEYLKHVGCDEKIKQRAVILDAGSGCTFFPYYLYRKFPNARVYCCDVDAYLASFFYDINIKMKMNIDFKVCNIQNLDYKRNFFNVIYCISVLEHTSNYKQIIGEFKRILKPNGLLIITFDISLDGKKNISINLAQDLLKELSNQFGIIGVHDLKELDLLKKIHEPNILTTRFGGRLNKKLLPWKLNWKQVIYEIIRLKIPKRPFWDLTVFCGAWRNEV